MEGGTDHGHYPTPLTAAWAVAARAGPAAATLKTAVNGQPAAIRRGLLPFDTTSDLAILTKAREAPAEQGAIPRRAADKAAGQ